MSLSKRMKRIQAERFQDFNESQVRQPLPPPDWTTSQFSDAGRMKTLLEKLTYQSSHDLDSVRQLIRLGHLFEGGSIRMIQIERWARHYEELRQAAAKDNLWAKISGHFLGLSTELELLRNSKERGGTATQ